MIICDLKNLIFWQLRQRPGHGGDQQNNISERLAQEKLNAVTHPDTAFWLNLMSLDDLSTNTLEATPSGSLVPQYAGTLRFSSSSTDETFSETD